MNERVTRHERPAPYDPATADPRPTPRGYEQPATPVARKGRTPPREASRSERDGNSSAERGDGYWFRQWVGASDGGTSADTGGDTRGGLALPGLVAADPAATEAFVDQLTPRLHASCEQQLDLLLHLPHLGRVRVNARRLESPAGWDIHLGGENADAQARLRRMAGGCAEALSHSLGQPVSVRVSTDEVPA